MQPLNDAFQGLGISVLNFNATQAYRNPNSAQVEFFCEIINEELFNLALVKHTLTKYGLRFLQMSLRDGVPNIFVDITCEGSLK